MLRHGPFFLAALAIAAGLKHHYSAAGSEDLAWILRPTAALVERISGIPFEEEAGAGFVNHARRIVIAPACAGVNFLIIAFCMAAFSGLRRIEEQRLKWLWLAGALLGACGLTVFVNAVRIVLSIYTYDADIHYGWLTPERVHRLEGVVIYFFFLCLFYRIIIAARPLLQRSRRDSVDTASGARRAPAGLVPLLWYGVITLAVPLLNGAFAKDARFAEHGAMIVAGSAGVLAVLFSIRLGWKNMKRWKIKRA